MRVILIVIVLLVASAFAQQQKYPWQHGDAEMQSDAHILLVRGGRCIGPQATAYGNRWVANDKDEKCIAKGQGQSSRQCQTSATVDASCKWEIWD